MTLYEQMGGSYRKVGDYYLPDLTTPEERQDDIGKYGLMRREYLKEHRRGLFSELLADGKLNKHLCEIDRAAYARMDFLLVKVAKLEGITEQLKAQNQMLWAQKMTSIRNSIEETILDELIYT